jgi:hypothetical protein
MASIVAIASQGSGKSEKPRALFRQPLALQWQEDGQLKKRAEGERQAGMFPFLISYFCLIIDHFSGRFELFLDLLYVAILANFAENLAEHVSGDNVVKYIVSIAPQGYRQKLKTHDQYSSYLFQHGMSGATSVR